MDKPAEKFSVGTYVRLRDGIDPSFYNGYSRTGNTAWVRYHKEDPYGYPQIFVEWDKDHWSYNGAPDCWTFESHFDLVKEPEPVNDTPNDKQQEVIRSITENFVGQLFQALTGAQDQSAEPIQEVTQPEASEKGVTEEAVELIQDASAYLVIGLVKKDVGVGHPVYTPIIYRTAINAQLGLALHAQLIHLVAAFQDDLISALPDTEEGS